MKAVSLFLISLLASCSSVKLKTNDLGMLELHGKVKYLTFKERGDKDTLDILKKVVAFNKKGNITTEDYFKTDTVSIGKPSTKTIYSYTKFGKIKVKKQYGSNGRLYRKEKYNYNSNNKLIKKNRFDEKGDPLFLWLYTYNNKGKRIEVLVTDLSYGGHTIDKSTFRYDTKGNLIESKNYDNNGVLQSVFSRKYKNNQLIASESLFNSKNAITKNTITKNTRSYNKMGNAIESKSYDENNQLITTFIRIYDSNNNKIETLYIKNNVKNKNTFKYSYDRYNNWIMKEAYINDKPKVITRREIEYYTK